MKKVFVDAFFFLALLNKRDAWHDRAIEIIDAVGGPVLTTQWVLVEVADAFCKPHDRGLFANLLELIAADDRIQVIGASSRQYQRGSNLYLRRADKAWSLTDCISFTVMEQHGISDALTGDHHFEQAGFLALLR
jgi:uncharacterized protein